MSKSTESQHWQDSKLDASQTWGKYMIDIYASRQGPALGTVSINEMEAMAKKKLADHPESIGYVTGSAGDSETCQANFEAFKRWKIIPRMLVDATVRNLETTVFGKKYPSPIILAPIGVQGLVHADAELASAAAAAKLQIPYTMSSASSRTPEEVAEANGDGVRFYQLYWPRSNDITLSLLDRAKKNGYKALFVTLDTQTLGWRPLDLSKAVMPFLHGLGTSVGFSDPVFMARYGRQPQHDRSKFPYVPFDFDKKFKEGDKETQEMFKLCFDWLQEINSGHFKSWEDVAFLRKNWDMPLILKGIQSVADAEMALKSGADGIVVSNHGGRQVDGAIGSLDALAMIMKSPLIQQAQKSGKFTVFFDSGIRRGSDILKAIAMGADACLIGRPYIYGLALGGQEGVEAVVRSLLADLDITLGLAGYRSVDEIRGKRNDVMMHDYDIARSISM